MAQLVKISLKELKTYSREKRLEIAVDITMSALQSLSMGAALRVGHSKLYDVAEKALIDAGTVLDLEDDVVDDAEEENFGAFSLGLA